MRLGAQSAVSAIPSISTGAISIDLRVGHRRRSARPRGGGIWPRVLRQDHAGPAGHRPVAAHRGQCGVRRTRSTRWIRSTPGSLESSSTTCSSRNRTTGEQALEIVEDAGSLRRHRRGRRRPLSPRWSPRAEIEGEMGESQVGLQARLMSQALRKLTGGGGEIAYLPPFHQPASREDRRDVRQSGNDHRGPGSEVLLVRTRRHPAHRGDQGTPTA